MKKELIGLFVLVFLVASGMGFVSGQENCDLSATIINQDPYPAVPGDYVDVVFQLTGVENPECGVVEFELLEAFPFSLDVGAPAKVEVRGGTYTSDFADHFMISYRVRVDENAIEGDNEVEVRFSSLGDLNSFSQKKKFDIRIEDVRTDFEVSVKEYVPATNIITFEILNIGESDVEALTIEIPKQDNINIKGANRNIVGDLDSNEDSTFTFEAVPQDGEITVSILYTDGLSVRRILEKTVIYDSSYFTDRKGDEVEPKPISYYLLIGLIILVIIVWIRGRIKRRRKMKAEREKLRRKK